MQVVGKVGKVGWGFHIRQSDQFIILFRTLSVIVPWRLDGREHIVARSRSRSSADRLRITGAIRRRLVIRNCFGACEGGPPPGPPHFGEEVFKDGVQGR